MVYRLYNFGINEGAESKFGHIKNSSPSRDMLRDHFTKNRKLLTNWWPAEGKKTSNNIFLILLNISNTSLLE